MNNILSKIEQYFVGVVLLLITALIFMNVVLRYFGLAIEWAEEVARYGIIWVTFIGSSICIYKGAHIGVDAIMNILPEKGKKILVVITILLSLFFTIIFTIKSASITMRVAEMNQVSSTLEVQMSFVYAAMPVGGALMLIRYIQQLILSIKNFNLKEEECHDSNAI